MFLMISSLLKMKMFQAKILHLKKSMKCLLLKKDFIMSDNNIVVISYIRKEMIRECIRSKGSIHNLL
jgi:hypothetical protein